MLHKRKPVKIGLGVLLALIIISGSLMTLSYLKVIAFNVPTFEETPLAPSPNHEYVPNQIIVKFKPGTPIEAEEDLNASLGTIVIYVNTKGKFKILQIPAGRTVAEMVDIYSRQLIVEYAEPNYTIHTQPETK